MLYKEESPSPRSSFFLVHVLRLRKVFYVLAQGLVVAVRLLDVLPVSIAFDLEVLDLVVEVHEGGELGDLGDLVPDLLCLSLLLLVGLFLVGFGSHV